jgi:hypothetical protein
MPQSAIGAANAAVQQPVPLAAAGRHNEKATIDGLSS